MLGFLASASCSLFTDLSGYVDDSRDAMAPVSSDGGATRDALDGEARDASGGGRDAPGDDAAPRPCASRSPAPFFCTDFDDGRSVVDLFGDQGGRWTLGQPVLDPLARSGTSSMLLRQINPVADCGYQDVSKDVVGSASMLLEYSLRLGDVAGDYPQGGSIASFSYRAANETGGCNLVLSASSTGASFTAQEFRPPEVGESFPLAVWPAPGVWTTIRIAISADTSSGGSRLVTSVGGKAALDRALPFCKLGTATVRVGTYCEKKRAHEVRIDDLVIDAR